MSIYEYRPLLYYCTGLALVFGAVMGSFLNCAAWRLAHEESFLKGRSHCPSCGHTLGASELIPVVSWLALKGRCKACGKKISARYPLTEILFALITAACLWRFDLTMVCLRNYIFLCCLFALALTDLESMIIPDGFHGVMVLTWLAFLPFLWTGWQAAAGRAAAAAVFGGGMLGISLVLDRMLGKESLGGGDIKLVAVCALYLGFAGMLFMLIASCIAGLVFAALRGTIKEGKAFPFGPFLAAAAGLMCLFGEPLIRWYLGLLGF